MGCNLLPKSHNLQLELEDARKSAKCFINTIEEQSIVIRFLENMCQMNCFAEISKEIIQAAKLFGLSTVVQLRGAEKDCTTAEAGAREIEEKMLTHLALTEERFIEFQGRLIVNFEHVSLLVKNMPSVDDEKYGSLKDTLNIMMKSVDSRVALLKENERIENHRRVAIESLLENTKIMLTKLEKEFSSRHKNSTEVMRTMIEDLDDSLVRLGLEEDQENHIRKIAEEALNALYSSIDSIKELDNVSEEILHQLAALVK